MHYISQLSLYVRCVPGMTVRDRELVALLHRLEDMAGRDTNLDTNELFGVLERVQCAEERIGTCHTTANTHHVYPTPHIMT